MYYILMDLCTHKFKFSSEIPVNTNGNLNLFLPRAFALSTADSSVASTATSAPCAPLPLHMLRKRGPIDTLSSLTPLGENWTLR